MKDVARFSVFHCLTGLMQAGKISGALREKRGGQMACFLKKGKYTR